MATAEVLVNTDVPYRRAAQFLEESVDRLGLGFVLKNADTSIREGQNPTEALNVMLKIKYSKLGEDFADYALLTIQPPSPVIKERLNYFLEARQL